MNFRWIESNKYGGKYVLQCGERVSDDLNDDLVWEDVPFVGDVKCYHHYGASFDDEQRLVVMDDVTRSELSWVRFQHCPKCGKKL